MPVDSRSNDRWFQHVAIIVSDMAQGLRAAARAPRAARLERPAEASGLEPERRRHRGLLLQGPRRPRPRDPGVPARARAIRGGRRRGGSFSGSTTPRSSCPTPRGASRSTATRSGCEVAGGAENYGTEQEHLNNVFGARLRITALRAAQGPGIEFLEYLAPSDGRPRPPDVRSNDLVAWQTELRVRDAAAAEKALAAARADFLSPGLVSVPTPSSASPAPSSPPTPTATSSSSSSRVSPEVCTGSALS